MKHELYDHITWVRPAKIPSTEPVKSGDLAPLEFPDKEEFIFAKYKLDKEEMLKNVSELAKKVMSMEMNPRKVAVNLAVKNLIDRVKRHDGDYGSMEAKCRFLSSLKINVLETMTFFSSGIHDR